MPISRLGIASLALLLWSSTALARTWYVRPDGAGDAPTIQAGIDSARSGDDVLVAPGRYSWTTQGVGSSDFGPTMIAMGSGVTLHSEAGAAATILDAEGRGRVLLCWQVQGGGRVEGFTITGGRAIRTGPLYGNHTGAGGGILALGLSDPTIANNVIVDNEASDLGGGVVMNHCSGILSSNIIAWNHAGAGAGGVDVYAGGGQPSVLGNTIAHNSGGGIRCGGDPIVVSRNILAQNGFTERGWGGSGVFCVFSTPTFECNDVWGNAAGDAICGTDAGGNFSEDPRFCASDPQGLGALHLRPDSPCLPGDNVCDVLIGAAGPGCTVTDVPRVPARWSTIKTLFR